MILFTKLDKDGNRFRYKLVKNKDENGIILYDFVLNGTFLGNIEIKKDKIIKHKLLTYFINQDKMNYGDKELVEAYETAIVFYSDILLLSNNATEFNIIKVIRNLIKNSCLRGHPNYMYLTTYEDTEKAFKEQFLDRDELEVTF